MSSKAVQVPRSAQDIRSHEREHFVEVAAPTKHTGNAAVQCNGKALVGARRLAVGLTMQSPYHVSRMTDQSFTIECYT